MTTKNINYFTMIAFLVFAVIVVAFSVRAGEVWLPTGNGNWDVATNWSGGNVPPWWDWAIVNNGGTPIVSDDPGPCSEIHIGDDGSAGNCIVTTGGILTYNNWLVIGRHGSGNGEGLCILTVTNGTVNSGTASSGNLQVGDNLCQGQMIVTGTGTVNVLSGGLYVGAYNGTGRVYVEQNGRVNFTAGAFEDIGGWNSQSAVYLQDNGVWNGAGAALNVPDWGGATSYVSITNNAQLLCDALYIGKGGVGEVNLWGGTVKCTYMEIGTTGNGTWNQYGGTCSNASSVALTTIYSGSSATVNLNGGTFNTLQVTGGVSTSTFNFNGGTLQAGAGASANFMSGLTAANVLANGAVIDSAGNNITIAQPLLDGGGGLTKLGSGALTLTGTNTYSGTTLVSAGKLATTTATTGTGAYTVADGAELSLTVQSANTYISPAGMTLGAAGATTLDFDLDEFGNPTNAPFEVAGTLTGNGTITVNVADTNPQLGQIPLIKYGSKSGAGSFVLGQLPPGVAATLVNNTSNQSIDLKITSTSAGTVFTINSGGASLVIRSNAGTYGVAILLTNGSTFYQQVSPMAVEVVTGTGISNWLTAAYSAAQDLGGGVCRCTGRISSANGSEFTFTDTYKAYDNTGMFEVDRSVAVAVASPLDAGFSTKLTFQRSVAGIMSGYDFFMPSIWYKDNTNVNNIALASNLADFYYWYREDRMPLPLFMLREKDNGVTFAVAHKNPNGGTFVGEDFFNRIIDGRMQFASMGMENNTQPSVGMLFPGSEGERTLILGGSINKDWALRSHPVSNNFTQTYSMVVRLTVEPDFPTALQNTWTVGYALFNPTNYNCDLNQIYSNGVSILNRYWESINGAAGEPFNVPLNGVITNDSAYSYQLGFTGMEPNNAAILVREGLQATNATLLSEGEQMLDFWASNSLTDSGCPMTWYDPYPQTWRSDPTGIRVATDGMLGLLWGWKQENLHGVAKTNWLNACTRFGDWIISQQGADGSIPRFFAWQNNQVTDSSKNNTSHIIRYLVELYMATGIPRYRAAAIAAGNYVYVDTFQNLNYQGGAATDGDTVPDKEAASLALRAFTALYDLTKDDRWLSAAVQAAYYYSTWIYSWNLPIPAGQPSPVYPLTRQTTGLSIIATGQFGCDSYASTDAFEVYRLYLFTGDPQLLEEAQMMLYNTKQGLNWNPADPIPGFGDPAMINEAMTLVASLRGTGVGAYLPWQTANYMEPMINFQDVFGAYGINEIELQPLADRQASNLAYGNVRGYLSAQLVLSATPGDGQIALQWTASANAVSYHLKRATISGEPYVMVASPASSSFTDTNVLNETTYYYVVSAVDGAGNEIGTSSEVSATPSSPLKALYAFEGNVLDTSGNGNNGINYGATFVPGRIGVQAAQFNGSAFVQIPLSIGSSGFTVALWVKTTDTGGLGSQWYSGEGLVDGEVAGVTNDFGTVLLNGEFALGIGNPDTTVASVKLINDGAWHHVAATWDSATGAMKGYVDGVLDNSGIGATAARTAPPNLRIGSIQTGVAGGFFKGTLDDVRLYGRVLSDPEIAALIPEGPLALTSARVGNQLLLSWPAWADSYGLYETASLQPPVIWVPATNGVQNTGTNISVTLPLTNGDNCFYRLQMQ